MTLTKANPELGDFFKQTQILYPYINGVGQSNSLRKTVEVKLRRI